MAHDLEFLKPKIRDYRDYWGLEIHYQEDIENASTYTELGDILTKYHQYIEDMANDAQQNLNRFRNEIGLDDKIMDEE